MLEPLPSRSVTRFLLPLADVMTLLFAIFLLLPHLEQQPGVQAGEVASPGSLWTAGEQRQVREELARLRRLTETPASRRLHLVMLRMEPATGDLLLRESNQEIALRSEADIGVVVQRDLETARAAGKELFYVLQLPGPETAFIYDTQHQQRYRQWFGKWKVRYEVPEWGQSSPP